MKEICFPKLRLIHFGALFSQLVCALEWTSAFQQKTAPVVGIFRVSLNRPYSFSSTANLFELIYCLSNLSSPLRELGFEPKPV